MRRREPKQGEIPSLNLRLDGAEANHPLGHLGVSPEPLAQGQIQDLYESKGLLSY